MYNLPNRLFFLLLTFCLFTFSAESFAQKKKNSKKDKGNNSLIINDFKPEAINKVIQLPGLNFPNINRLEYYYNEASLAKISRYERNKQWNDYFMALYQYVSNFGINNFLNSKDMQLMWRLARVSEYLGQDALTKEVYRLIIKHYRGDMRDALVAYDSMIRFEKPLYADLEYYYRLVEKRRQVDTLWPPEDVLIEMGEEVNSPFEDYGMTIGGENDKVLLFTSKRNVKDTSRLSQDLYGAAKNEDIYYSYRDEYNNWTVAEPFEEINSEYNEGSPSISKTGDEIYFVRCHSPEGRGDCDIYKISKDGDGEWTQVQNLGPNINSYAWDSHPALSMTEDTLFFSSSRKGGFGGTDLYFSAKQEDGSWGKAQNLGPVINSMKNEVSPYPHAKYGVLYYSSDGQLLNFGQFDIFKSFMSDGKYTEPKNVGPLVNGEGDEFYFAIDSKSKWLFYAKTETKGGRNLNLQSFPLPMAAKPNNIVRFSGKVIEPSTGEVFQGVVTVIDMTDGVEVAPKQIREDGSFDFELIDKKKYLLIIEGDNFFRIEEVFFMDGDKEVNIPAVSVNSTLTFKSIDFETNSAKLLPGMENNLHLIIDFMQLHPKYRLRVTGHTDSDGDKEFNLQLSKLRAEAIREYILAYGGFSENKVIAEGKGDLEPVVENAVSDEDKALNRRVEFKLFLDEYGIVDETEVEIEEW